MMNILSSLNNCIRVSFELLAIFSILTALLLFFRLWKKGIRKKDHTIFFSLICLFFTAAVWRSSMVLLSSRYAAFFIFPAIALGAWGGYFLPTFLFRSTGKWKKWKERFSFGSNEVRLAGRICILIFTAIFIGKTARYNRYGDNCKKSAMIIRQEVKKNNYKAVCLDFCGDQRRISYYTRLACTAYPDKGIVQPGEIPFRKKDFPDSRDAVYIFCNFKSEKPISPASLGVAPEEWQEIFVSPRNNRKKSFLHVYRFRPGKKE